MSGEGRIPPRSRRFVERASALVERRESFDSRPSSSSTIARALARPDRPARRPRIQVAPHTQKFQSNVRRTLHFLNKLKTDDLVLVARDLALDHTFQETVQELQDLKVHLEQVLRRVEDYQSDI